MLRDWIVLVGPRGSGKTTVGRALALELGVAFLDLDDAIERIAGKSIARIFAEEGERRFRELEALELRTILSQKAGSSPPQVVATGGGIVVQLENRARLKALGCVFLLSAPAPVLIDRLRRDASRPRLTDLALEDEVVQVGLDRAAWYTSVSDATIAVDQRTVAEVVSEVMRIARERGVLGD